MCFHNLFFLGAPGSDEVRHIGDTVTLAIKEGDHALVRDMSKIIELMKRQQTAKEREDYAVVNCFSGAI